MVIRDKLRGMIQEIHDSAREVLRIDSEISDLEDKYEETERRIQMQKELKIRLFGSSFKLVKSVESILKPRKKRNEKNENSQKQREKDSTIKSVSDSS